MGTLAGIMPYLLYKGAGFAETMKSFSEHKWEDGVSRAIDLLTLGSLVSGDKERDFIWNSTGVRDARNFNYFLYQYQYKQ